MERTECMAFVLKINLLYNSFQILSGGFIYYKIIINKILINFNVFLTFFLHL